MISLDRFDMRSAVFVSLLTSHHASHHWQQEPNQQLNVAFSSSRCPIWKAELLTKGPLSNQTKWQGKWLRHKNHTSELERLCRHAGRHFFWKLRQKCKCIEWITRTQKQNRKSETNGTGAAFRKICSFYYYDDYYYYYYYHFYTTTAAAATTTTTATTSITTTIITTTTTSTTTTTITITTTITTTTTATTATITTTTTTNTTNYYYYYYFYYYYYYYYLLLLLLLPTTTTTITTITTITTTTTTTSTTTTTTGLLWRLRRLWQLRLRLDDASRLLPLMLPRLWLRLREFDEKSHGKSSRAG